MEIRQHLRSISDPLLVIEAVRRGVEEGDAALADAVLNAPSVLQPLPRSALLELREAWAARRDLELARQIKELERATKQARSVLGSVEREVASCASSCWRHRGQLAEHSLKVVPARHGEAGAQLAGCLGGSRDDHLRVNFALAQQAHGGLAECLRRRLHLPLEVSLIVLLIRHARLRRLGPSHQIGPTAATTEPPPQSCSASAAGRV